jgi:hypothetical protein
LPDKQVRRISIRKAGRQEKKHATTSFLLSYLPYLFFGKQPDKHGLIMRSKFGLNRQKGPG